MTSCAPVPAAATTPTGPRAHGVGETERQPVDDRRAGPRTHDQETPFVGAALESHLVLQRDPVAEEQHVQAGAERLVGLEGRVLAGHGDHRDVALRARQAARRARARASRRPPGRGGVEDLLRGGEAGLGLRPSHGQHEVVGAGPLEARIREAHRRGLLAVRGGAHEAQGALDAVNALGGAGGGHHLGAVGPAAAADADRGHVAVTARPSGPARRGSAWAPSASSSVSAARRVDARPPSTSTAPGRRWMKGDACAIA